jgi:hypothetical protein
MLLTVQVCLPQIPCRKEISTAIKTGIENNIREAYSFLCLNYRNDEDEIILIGFSRGAFTVRALAFLINQVGLLKREGIRFLHDVFEAWSEQSCKNDLLDSVMEKVEWLKLRHYPVKIQACAVWDTVAALGRGRLDFVDETIPACVEQTIHALALNEERSQFEPLLFHRDKGQSLKQCWFLGSHSDVGGGNKKLGLANISLAWMMAQLKDLVYFDPEIVKSMTSQQHHDYTSEVLKAEILHGSSKGQLQAYQLEVAIPIQEFQAKSDIHVGTFAKTQRVAGWKYRKPFRSACHTEETLHWTVPILLEKGCVSTCVPLQKFGYAMQNTQGSVAGAHSNRPKSELPTLFERSVLASWIINESLQAAYRALDPSQDLKKAKIEALSMIPIYAVFWQPEVWNLTSSTNLGRQIHVGLKYGGQMRFQTPTLETTVDVWRQSVEVQKSWSMTTSVGFFAGPSIEHHSVCKVLTGKITVPLADTLMSLDKASASNETHAENSLQASDPLSADMVATLDGIYSTTRRDDGV